MKKIISTLLAVSMLAVSTPAVTVDAAFELPKTDNSGIHYVVDDSSNGMKKGSNPDLKALASSLGADTDYFKFPNYPPTSMSDEAAQKLGEQEKSTFHSIVPEAALAAIASGTCHGFALLQILTHNGIISPSDIQEGAETLYDIDFADDVNDAICYYALMQLFIQETVYKEYFCSHDTADQCRDLIEKGELSMKNGKYFLINFLTPTVHHAVAGIGIADGNWTYNGKTYDKCILTLDSNLVSKDDENVSAGFSEKACIYVNSKTNQFYMPAYGYGSEDEDTFITSVISDDDLLNHCGLINPSKDIKSEYYDIHQIYVCQTGREYDISVNYNGRTEKEHGYPKKDLQKICKNCWVASLVPGYGTDYYKKADFVYYETTSDIPLEDCNHDAMSVNFHGYGHANDITAEGKTKGMLSEKKVYVENLDSTKEHYSIFMRQIHSNDPYYWLSIGGDLDGRITMELRDDGVLISGTKGIACYCDLYVEDKSVNDPNVVNGDFTLNLTTSNDVLLKFVNDHDPPKIMLDPNGDDIYDYEVEKGDVNCDGNIDAVDASLVLSGYAAAQTGNQHYINVELGDYDNDGNMDAIDASSILAYYAYTQTNKQ